MNGATTTTAAPTGSVWASLIEHSLDGWLGYLNRPRDPVLTNAYPFPSSASDLQVATLNAQLTAQQQTQKMLLMLAAGGLVLYLVMK